MARKSFCHSHNQVKKILDESYMEARRILLENKDPLHRLANALMKYETLDKSQIEKVIRGISIE